MEELYAKETGSYRSYRKKSRQIKRPNFSERKWARLRYQQTKIKKTPRWLLGVDWLEDAGRMAA